MAKYKPEIPSQVLRYLVTLSQLEATSVTKLAGLTLIQEFLKTDNKVDIRTCFLQYGLLDSLLIAFDEGLQDGNLALLEVTLKSLFFLSQLPIGKLQPLITESLIRRLLMLLDTKQNFYRYSKNAKVKCQKLIENKHLIGSVADVEVNSTEWLHLQKVFKSSLNNLPKMTINVCMCSLVLSDDETEEEDISVRDYLVTQQLVWPKSNPDCPYCEDERAEENWKDIIVTEVINGPLFWAQVGLTSIHNVQKIQACLHEIHQQGNLQQCVTCKKDDIVVVSHCVNGSHCFIRARILSVDVMVVKLWALDYGYLVTKNIKCVFTLPSSVHIDKWHSQVTLCCLTGVQEPPLDDSVIHTAVAILCNLCRASYPAGKMVEKLGGLDVCAAFLKQCPVGSLKVKVIQLVNNLACNSKLSVTLAESNMVETIMAQCSHFFESADETTLTKILTCLYSLLYKNEGNRKKFYHNEGIETVLKCCMIVKRHSIVYRAAMKCLNEFLNSAGKNSSALPEKGSKYLESGRIMPTEFCKLVSSSDDGKDPLAVEKVIDKHRLFMTNDHSSDEETADERSNKSVKESTVTVNVADIYKQMHSQNCYVKDEKVPFEADIIHEIRPNESIAKVSSAVIAQHVCGMLNSGKGGTIYFGITNGRRVQGVVLDRDSRDEFRLGVDRMMTDKLQPCLLHSLFNVIYVPVVEYRQNQVTPLQNLYVAEIQVKPSKGILYTLRADESCFFRLGCHTTSLTKQELRHLMVLEEEECYRTRIQKLNLELQQLEELYDQKKQQKIDSVKK